MKKNFCVFFRVYKMPDGSINVKTLDTPKNKFIYEQLLKKSITVEEWKAKIRERKMEK